MHSVYFTITLDIRSINVSGDQTVTSRSLYRDVSENHMPKDNRSRKPYQLLFAALVAGSLMFHAAILWESRHKIAAGYGDFIIFYTGAQIVNDGRAKELFNVDTQNAYQSKFDVPQLEWPLPFNHAPYELVLFLPLAYLPYPIAHLIWSGGSVILLVLMLRWSLPYVNSPHNLFIAAALAAWFPTMEALRLGQDSILSTVLLLAVFIFLKRKRNGWAGFFLALGLYKPQLVLPVAGALLVARSWRTVAVFATTGVLLAVISVAMVGLQGVFHLLSILRSMQNYSFIINPRNMPNIRGLSTVLLYENAGEWLAGSITIGVSVVLYALCLYAWRQKFDTGDRMFDLQFALVVVTTVLVSYHLYAHDLFPISLSIILLYRYVSSGSRQNTSIAFFGLLLIMFLPVVPRFLIEVKLFGWGALPVLLLYMILAAEIFCRQRLAAVKQ